jgi:signal peptide peptidase SppA
MKRYPHLINRLFYEPLAITPAHHASLCRVLESRLAAGAPDPRRRRAHDDDPDLDGDDEEADTTVTVKSEAPPKPDWQTFGPDAIIPVHGVLVGHASDIPLSTCGCGLDTISAMIDVALADKEVKKIIFDFRTPGGAVIGIPELARKIASIQHVETIAFTDDQCCSAGVWLATQCRHFFTTSSAQVGSIGVWTACLDLSRYMANQGENMQAISAGKYKLMGAYWRPLSDDEKSILQAGVDKTYAEFKDAVKLHRELDDQHMQGQIFDGDEAVQIGLCDGLVESLDELLFDDGDEDSDPAP